MGFIQALHMHLLQDLVLRLALLFPMLNLAQSSLCLDIRQFSGQLPLQCIHGDGFRPFNGQAQCPAPNALHIEQHP